MLTSLEKQDLNQMGINLSPENYVKKLAKIAIKLRLDGIVSSAREAKLIRSICPQRIHNYYSWYQARQQKFS